MDAPLEKQLRLWDDQSLTIVHDAPSSGRILPGPHNPGQFAERLFADEVLNPDNAGATADETTEPYTLQWFLNIENQRHSRHGRWIPRLLEFAKHSGETLLGLGSGLGTDWLQYARHGASVVVCNPAAEQLGLIRRNFELRGLGGRFFQAAPTTLPLENASVDVACLVNLLSEVADPPAVVQEVYRVLKPGGKVVALTAARYDVDYWSQTCFPWTHWFGRRTAADASVVRYSARRLRRLFGAFIEHRVHKRQLRRSEVPHAWRWLPLPLLERVMGHVLVLKAFKPLSAAISVPLAA